MNIHLIRDREVDATLYADVLSILKGSPGTINFIAGEDVAIMERRLYELEVEEIEQLEESFKEFKVDEKKPPMESRMSLSRASDYQM